MSHGGAAREMAGLAAPRSATLADLPALATLEQRVFEPPKNRPWSSSQLSQELDAGSLFLVSPSSGAPLGYAIFRIIAGEAELLRLATAPRARRRGHGHRLLRAGLERLCQAGVEICHLEVRADNSAALTLYRRHGFEEVGRRPAYYQDGCAARVLSRRLPRA